MYFLCFQAEDGIRDLTVTGVQTCALPISRPSAPVAPRRARRRPAPVRSNAGALAAEQPELAGRDHDHHERPASLGIGDAPIDSTRRTPGEVEADTQAERGGSAGQTDRGHEEGPAAGGKPSSTRRNAR